MYLSFSHSTTNHFNWTVFRWQEERKIETSIVESLIIKKIYYTHMYVTWNYEGVSRSAAVQMLCVLDVHCIIRAALELKSRLFSVCNRCFQGAGTDEACLIEILSSRSNAEIQETTKIYKAGESVFTHLLKISITCWASRVYDECLFRVR